MILKNIICVFKRCLFNMFIHVLNAMRGLKPRTFHQEWPKLIGHALYRCNYPHNSLELYRYLVEELKFEFVECDVIFTEDHIPVLSHDDVIRVFKDHEPCDVSICKSKYSHLRSFSLCEDRFLPVTSLTELLEYISKHKIWVMLDLCHCNNTFQHSAIIHKQIKRYSLIDRVLIGDGAPWCFILLSNQYNVQFEVDFFNDKHSFYLKYFRFFHSIVLSHVYKEEALAEYKEAINKIHNSGLLAKCSMVNNAQVANELLKAGADFLITDSVTPNEIQDLK